MKCLVSYSHLPEYTICKQNTQFAHKTTQFQFMDKSEFLQKVYALNYEVRIFPKATINWYLLLEWTAEDLFATKTIIRESYLYSLSIREDSDPGFKKKFLTVSIAWKKKKGVILPNYLLSWTLRGGLMRLSSVRGPYSDCGDENPGIKQENIHSCSLLQLFWSACSHSRKRRTPSRRIWNEKTEQGNKLTWTKAIPYILEGGGKREVWKR